GATGDGFTINQMHVRHLPKSGGTPDELLRYCNLSADRRAGFFVLKAPDIPSVLLELGFLSSEADRTRLTSPEFASTVADAIIVGLLRWRAIADPAFKAPRN
ncbi:MAG: N-acetylmuramoyl-L-alanine amidase, partial [Pseudomonadota bacterium]